MRQINLRDPEEKLLVQQTLRDVAAFAARFSGLRLRGYQLGPARAIVDSVLYGRGLTFVVVFPRQSGKNELQAQLETYLLAVLHQSPAELIKVSPTWKPQSLNAMRRLERVLANNYFTSQLWQKESGYIYRVGRARISFLSGDPTSNVVGATASTLLECDEAQDVMIAKWDKELNPMAASTNATRIFWGTAWTSQTLLARELRAAMLAEQLDGRRRVFQCNANLVRGEVPAYGVFVDEQIARLGRDNPLIRTQFFSEELDAQGGMFPEARQELMHGDHPAQSAPQPGGDYAFLLDVAGEDETAQDAWDGQRPGPLANPGRDATALTIVQLDLSQYEALRGAIYRVVARRLWTGVKHTQLYGQLLSLVERWGPRRLVVDATGIGAGLASFLSKALGEGRVIPFHFNAASKSKLGWDFLTLVDSGRFKDHQPGDAAMRGVDVGGQLGLTRQTELTAVPPQSAQSIFWRQAAACEMEVLPGPARQMRWGVPEGRRDAADGQFIHDDLLVSAALCAALEAHPLGGTRSAVVRSLDPLASLGEAY